MSAELAMTITLVTTCVNQILNAINVNGTYDKVDVMARVYIITVKHSLRTFYKFMLLYCTICHLLVIRICRRVLFNVEIKVLLGFTQK